MPWLRLLINAKTGSSHGKLKLVAQSSPSLCEPMAVAHQAPLSIEFSRPETWRGQLFPSTGDLPNLGTEPGSPALQEDSLPSEPPDSSHTVPFNNHSVHKYLFSTYSIPGTVQRVAEPKVLTYMQSAS